VTRNGRSAPWKVSSRWQTVALAVLTVLLLVTGYLALTRDASPPPFTPAADAAVPMSGLAPTRPSMLFVGDSFAAGSGTTGPDLAYSCLTADLMDWVCNLDAQGGTGYISDGSLNSRDFGPFSSRLSADAARYRADIVIVDGGRNDSSVEVKVVALAAQNYLRGVRAQWPRAALVVLVPAFVNSTPANFPFAEQFGQQLREIVKPLGGIVIDPMTDGWIPPANAEALLDPDGVHPNPDGHQYLAQQLSSALRAVGLSDVPITDIGSKSPARPDDSSSRGGGQPAQPPGVR
jgi:lysophospholipase L1-like esterase